MVQLQHLVRDFDESTLLESRTPKSLVRQIEAIKINSDSHNRPKKKAGVTGKQPPSRQHAAGG